MRPRGTGSVCQRKNGTFMGQLDLGLVDGKRKRVTIYGPTRRAVELKLKALARQLDEKGDLPTSDMTVEKWLTHWLENIARRRLKPNTYRSYRTIVNHYLIPAIGRKKVSALSAAHVREMHDFIADKGRSPTTAHNAHRVLAVALNDGVRDGRIPRNVASVERAPRKKDSEREAMAVADAIKVLRTAADDRLGTRWLTALMTGMRQGERLGLRWSHLDLTEGKADLAWALQRANYRHGCGRPPTCERRAASCPQRELGIPAHMAYVPLAGNLVLMRPKTKGSTRVVALVEPLRVALVRRHAAYLAERENYTHDHGLVFCNADGSPINPRQDWLDWRDLLGRAEVPVVTGHEARHTTATLLLEMGVPGRVVEEILGHTEAATTKGYQHVSLAMQREALDGLAQVLELGGA